MPDLSIIIVNYNTCEPLRRCLESIRREGGGLEIQTIVVDNGSKDGSPAMVREVMPDAIVIEPGYNSWFTGGSNIGAASATGQYLLILNPDTVIIPGALPALVAYLRANPHVGGVSPRQHFPDGPPIPICSRTPRFPDLLLSYTPIGALLPALRDRYRAAMFYADWDRTTTRAVEVVPDSSLLMPRDLWEQLGGFDEALKLYFTEDDLCRRIINSGREVHLYADALILHEEHASVSQVQRLASQAYFDDLIVFCRKYYGRAAALLLRLLVTPTRWGMDVVQQRRGERRAL